MAANNATNAFPHCFVLSHHKEYKRFMKYVDGLSTLASFTWNEGIRKCDCWNRVKVCSVISLNSFLWAKINLSKWWTELISTVYHQNKLLFGGVLIYVRELVSLMRNNGLSCRWEWLTEIEQFYAIWCQEQSKDSFM
jgi:hypothetical protein